jgi:chromosome segregation ATPase
MPETIASIKKENDALKRQIESLQKDFSKLQIMIESKESPKQDGASKETQAQMHGFQTSLDFVSNEYDTLNAFQTEAKNEFKKLNSRLTEIATKVNDVGDALEQIQQYSYQYNIKIIGLPQQDERESAYQTSSLCVNPGPLLLRYATDCMYLCGFNSYNI